MLFQLHEWDIHIACSDTGGVRVTIVRIAWRPLFAVVLSVPWLVACRAEPD